MFVSAGSDPLLGINHSAKLPQHCITRDPAGAEIDCIKNLLIVSQQECESEHCADPLIRPPPRQQEGKLRGSPSTATGAGCKNGLE